MNKNKEEIQKLLKKINTLLKKLPQEEIFSTLGTYELNS
jgi:Txe/YoeB family toxin of Txe-Axe toxin-antitoxin module